MGSADPSEPSCWVHITAGVGPVECQWVVAQVLAALQLEATAAGLAPELLEAAEGEAPGTLRSALLALRGDAAGLLATWQGTVKWSGRSAHRATHRRNFFVGVEALQAPTLQPPGGAQRSGAPSIADRDLVFTTLRSSGPGGQHVNKTESAVRLTHTPTGLAVVAREERSQHQNKRLALARLAALLAAQETAAQADAERARWAQHHQLERGNPVRVYSGPDFKRKA